MRPWQSGQSHSLTEVLISRLEGLRVSNLRFQDFGTSGFQFRGIGYSGFGAEDLGFMVEHSWFRWV